ncbi:MAG TPA: Crp/Fnr family transcriptional regulator [Saprospiraceae bacterium]|nr:Crp/Fnr family transcriptional regulator [Saprospiraceae bacterium]
MEKLEKKLSENKILSKHSIIELLDVWQKTKVLKAKESLISLNQKDINLYFIKSGCVRLFVFDNEGNDKNLGFGYENTFITSFQSFLENKPSLLSIEAVLETEVYYISKNDLMNLVVSNAEITRWYQHMIECTLSGHIQRQVELLTLSPQERYEVFKNRSGHLLNVIPLKLIASYLMMTPETLSRIRAKIS